MDTSPRFSYRTPSLGIINHRRSTRRAPWFAALLPSFLAAIALPLAAVAQTYTPLYDFGNVTGDPTTPQGHFAQARDGNLYNTSSSGGENGYGTVFRLTPAGKVKVLWNFTGENAGGGQPGSGVTLGTDGNLYGATTGDGAHNHGTLFKITTAGKLTVLYNFTDQADGVGFAAAPIQATNGSFYGVTGSGLSNHGSIYKLTRAGVLTVIYQFTGHPDNNYSYPQSLIQGTDGNFYGTTKGSSYGMVFKVTAKGKLTVLHEFTGYPSDGQQPIGGLVQGTDGNFYGTTELGGSGKSGTVYRITPAGAITILHNFDEDTNGFEPVSPLTQGTDGNFYAGTSRGGTPSGGGAGKGVLYQITPTGTYQILFSDFIPSIGTFPDDPLIQHTSGTFYGDTNEGGTGSSCLFCGTLFSLKMGLGPFVTFVPSQSSGKVGASVGILGQGFTGTTKVTFAGISAAFKVVSDTYLTVTVPVGATTGAVAVTLPGSVLTSNKVFQVTPTSDATEDSEAE